MLRQYSERAGACGRGCGRSDCNLPVFAPVGTVAVTFELGFTVKVVALTPPNVTCDALFRPPPKMTTETPTFPLIGLKLAMLGATTDI
jgi:hypothetical protein